MAWIPSWVVLDCSKVSSDHVHDYHMECLLTWVLIKILNQSDKPETRVLNAQLINTWLDASFHSLPYFILVCCAMDFEGNLGTLLTFCHEAHTTTSIFVSYISLVGSPCQKYPHLIT